MGMDLNVYQLLRPLDPTFDDAETNCRTLMLTPAQVQALRGRFPDLQAQEEEFVNVERLCEFAGVPGDWNLSSWDLSTTPGWAELSDPRGTEPSKLVEVESAQYLDKGPLLRTVFEVRERGYLRKPFRFRSTPTRVEGDTLVLTVDNFTGSDLPKLHEVLGPQVVQECYGVFGYEDLHRLRQLKDLSSMPSDWQRLVLDQMEPDCVTVIDW